MSLTTTTSILPSVKLSLEILIITSIIFEIVVAILNLLDPLTIPLVISSILITGNLSLGFVAAHKESIPFLVIFTIINVFLIVLCALIVASKLWFRLTWTTGFALGLLIAETCMSIAFSILLRARKCEKLRSNSPLVTYSVLINPSSGPEAKIISN